MRVTLLVAVVAPRTGKTIKNGLQVFGREENLIQNGTLCIYFKPIVRNRVSKLELTQAKNGLF